MGVGLLRAGAAAKLRWLAVPATALLLGAVWLFARTPIAVPADPDEFIWAIFDASGARVPLWLVVAALFALVALFFVPLGALLGDAFRRVAPLRAYAWDIGGSLTGILAFALLSAARQPPAVWFGVGFTAWLLASLRERTFAAAIAATGIGAVLAATAMRPAAPEYWSPYYRIDVAPDPAGYRVDVNGALHQMVLDLDSARAADVPYARTARQGYLLPYRWIAPPETALVVGAGTGNDLALMLAQGVHHVDAVEIDPVIADLGRALHPQRPYDDPRVRLHIDDARAYLRTSERRYDLIVFGTLDSQTLLSGMSSVRLDNYVYTVESFAAARQRLADGGTLVVYHRSAEPYIGAKIYQMIGAAFGEPPGTWFGDMNLFNLIFVAGRGRENVPPLDPGVRTLLEAAHEPPTDDWPYLYLRTRTVPGHYRVALLSAVAISLLLVLVAAGPVVRRGPDPAMFFMGTGFLLVETKSVTEMSLLFGSTWTVNVLVFAAILVMVLLANLWVLRGSPMRLGALFAGLFASLAFAWLVPARSLLWLGTGGQWLLGGLMVALPILFAALVFSTLFRDSADPPRALAYNLLGAILGGVLEYGSMALGIKALYLVAGAVYLLAWFFATRRRKRSMSPALGTLLNMT